jgi:hypothetical protein
MNANRRRIAVPVRAIDRSAVFMVPMRNRFPGRVNSSFGEYCRLIDLLRYPGRKYSSPNAVARFARLISPVIRMQGVVGLSSATSATSRNGSGRSLKASPPPSPGCGRNPGEVLAGV